MFVFISLNNQAKLAIKSKRSLVTSFASELLIVKALKFVEISFIRGVGYDCHDVEESVDYTRWVLMCSFFLGVELLEFVIVEGKSQRLLLWRM